MAEEEKKEHLIQSVVRATDILKCFYNDRELGLIEMARRTGLNKSTAFGLVNTLVSCGFLQQNPESGRYSVGVEVFCLGQRYKSDIGRQVHPYLVSLTEEFQETANFIIRDGNDAVYVDKVESPFSMRIRIMKGQRMPLYCNGAGKALWAFLPDSEKNKILTTSEYKKLTEKTITSRKAMEKELDRIFVRGYSVDDEESEIGLYCLAVPIIGTDGYSVGAISVSGPTVRMTSDVQEKIIISLKKQSSAISRNIIGLR